MENNLIQTLVSIRKEHGLTIDELAEKLQWSAESICDYEKGITVPPVAFIEKAEKFFGVGISGADNWETVFSQGFFGPKIPLILPEDLVADNYNRIRCYFELPNLKQYGENRLFALHYTGESLPEKGILHDSILVFFECDCVDRPGIYAIISRGKLAFKDVTVSDDKYRIEPLDSKKHFPVFRKTCKAAGRLVSCINNF